MTRFEARVGNAIPRGRLCGNGAVRSGDGPRALVGGLGYADSLPELSIGTALVKERRALAGRLRRAQTFLRTLGIEIAFGREGRLGTRTITITAVGETRPGNTVSAVSSVSDHQRSAALNHSSPGLEQAL